VRYSGWRREAPLFYAILIIGAIEAAATHLVVVHLSPLAAWLLTAISLLALSLILLARHLLRTRMVALADDALLVPVGVRDWVRVPVDRLALAASGMPPERAEHTLETLSLFGCNVELTITPPLIVRWPGRERVLRVLMSLDDVAGFTAELLRRKAPDGDNVKRTCLNLRDGTHDTHPIGCSTGMVVK
jgi:hypothetical protein